MTTAPLYMGDQPVLNPAVVNGVIQGQTPAIMDANGLPSGVADYTFSANWVQTYNGVTLQFRPGQPNAIDTALLAALNAAGAPITAA
jgi:hypothetical protein